MRIHSHAARINTYRYNLIYTYEKFLRIYNMKYSITVLPIVIPIQN